MQATMHIFIAICCLALLLASTYFSRKLTKPIHNMMDQMGEVENGNFDIELPVESNDEIGVLSERFNRMSKELKNYINQSYVAQIKQTEAELAALKSQIYPHFLYNTLEIIRMTALENDDEQVSKMIEALSVQIHYLIGQVQDMVPLEKELDIVEKYVYLLNCRISEAVSLTINANGNAKMNVPRLVLQPIVENAYVHGVKTKKGRKSIMIEAVKKEENLELSVMDNGVGMDKETLEQLNALLAGDSPGIKNEYDWQSIGLKNVHDRIRYLYGEEYGIRVTSNVGVGTIVTVILPYEMNVVLESNSTP
jgi:two-component system sensor histidine kinase YesM